MAEAVPTEAAAAEIVLTFVPSVTPEVAGARTGALLELVPGLGTAAPPEEVTTEARPARGGLLAGSQGKATAKAEATDRPDPAPTVGH